jgi:hypothetical protein
MNEKEQMIKEMAEELLSLLEPDESLRISRCSMLSSDEVVSIIEVVNDRTGIIVNGGVDYARLLASRI